MTKRMNDINTFMATKDNETCLVGTDEMGEDFIVWFNTIDLLEWLDIWYMKKQSKHYIEELNKQIMKKEERREAKKELILGFVFMWSCFIGYYLIMKIITL